MRSGPLWRRIWRCAGRAPSNRSTAFARSSTACATSCASAASGATCPTICLHGRWSINSPSAGFSPDASRPWSRTCAFLGEFLGRKAQPTAMILDSLPLTCLRLPHDRSILQAAGMKLITGSCENATISTPFLSNSDNSLSEAPWDIFSSLTLTDQAWSHMRVSREDRLAGLFPLAQRPNLLRRPLRHRRQTECVVFAQSALVVCL